MEEWHEQKWIAASEGDPAALEEMEGVMLDGLKRMTEEGRPSTGQDMLKGRRTEIDFSTAWWLPRARR